MENITYITEEAFRKLTREGKAKMTQCHSYPEQEISKLVLIHTNKKMGGYSLGDFFAYTEGKGWWRPMTYDCWRIVTDIQAPVKLRYQILKGDFEYGGVRIFGFADEHCKAYISYGGEIVIKNK